MADRRPSQNQDQNADGSSDRLGPAFGRLKGGRAFPAGFDARAIARRSRRRRWTLRGGAVALVGLAALWTAFDPGLTADYRAPVGTIERITLPDGTLAQLDSGGSMSWSQTDRERRLHLHAGTVVLETASGAAGDFVVETSAQEVRPIGTVFAVTAEDSDWSALVEAGQVRVTLPKNVASTLIGPGEAAMIGGGGELTSAPIDVAQVLAWRDGVLEFENALLADVIATLDRYKPGRILLFNDAVALERFDGVLSLNSIDEALQIVAASSNLQIVTNWPLLVILR